MADLITRPDSRPEIEPDSLADRLLETQSPVGEFDPARPVDHADHRRDSRYAVRLGLAEVTSIGQEVAERIVAEREAQGPFASMTDLTRRVRLTVPQVEALATARAFDCFRLDRRQALWNSGRAALESLGQLEGLVLDSDPPMLPDMEPSESTMADLWALGISPDDHPMSHVRERLRREGVLEVGALAGTEPGRVRVAGIVTHRQRPATAAGVTFLNLEDETGMLNVICSTGVWGRYRRVARQSNGLVVRGMLERRGTVVNLIADRIERLPDVVRTTSRDFR
jgi:error-prone DNA polymerase